MLVALLVFAGCSGGGATGRHQGDALPTDSGSPGSTLPSASGTPTAGLSPGATPGSGSGSLVGGGGGGVGGPGTPNGIGGYTIPNLFTSAENQIGIYPDHITLCTHAALNLSAVFGVDAGDLNVYWDYVNQELGGIYGRKVIMSYADDKYGNQPSDVRNAYEECKAKKPFILLGGIGFDQIPAVRAFAEQDHQLYIHHIAREDFTKKYSFSFLPSVETIGHRVAQWVLHAHPGQKIGAIYRQSENWEPGHKTFKAELAAHGVKVDPDLPVQKNASVYSTQISALQGAKTKVVFIWENALAAIEIIQQAKKQGFNPQWIVFPFNLMTDKLGNAMVNPIPVEGIATWPAYRPGVTNASYSSYASEIKFFETEHAKYGTGKTDDITWMTWLGWRQLHKLLLDCGKECTRNKIVGLLQSGVHKPIFGCPFNFGVNGHVGGFHVNIFRADIEASKPGWENIELCKDHF